MAGKKGQIREGSVFIRLCSRVFYNPEMEFCRDVSSLCVGAAGGKLSLLDAMCGTGIRGLRYKKENENVASLVLLDISGHAVKCARRNAAMNKIRCRAIQKDVCEHLQTHSFDFVELDPFGSPAPYLYDAARSFREKKCGWLSLTATDMAVLCGAHHAACLKNYGAVPLDNEFCHENAARILAGKVVLSFSPFNLLASPAFTLSHRHYLKMVFRLQQGASLAVDGVKKLGFVSYCPGCCFRQAKRLASLERCPHCNHLMQIAGPVYLGELWESPLVERMLEKNSQRNYKSAAKIERLLKTMIEENKIGGYGYYDLHVIAKKFGGRIASMEEALERLRSEGFEAQRTHFRPTAIRTNAPHERIVEIFSNK
ncbi:MAG: tRNA (guanine(10)-N(2))-dimethyltransferase [Candidatus Micrarchaeota archaeon]|nr:tRNA (guanine(10)-N(2))-dimethyltransferase [Candidatus Micrarchaeota archaeon]